MRVIVVGAGEVGSSIAESLSGDHEVVVVDIDPDRVESLTYSHDVLAIEGDGSEIETLEEAGIDEADMLIASTDDDETNIVTCGTATVFPDVFTIARVKRPQFLRTWERGDRTFGVDFMVCTDLLTAQNIVGVIGLPTARDVDTFADGVVQMAEFELPAESPVVGQTVQEADRFDSLTFAAIVREDGIVIPRGDTVLEAGDDVVVIGSPDSTRQFSAEIAPQQTGPRDIVIVGGSEVGYQVARLLETREFSPRLIERDPERARWLAERLPATTVMQSDATDQEFLERENVGEADVLIAALENDQQNLLAGLLAQRLGTDRVVAVVDTVEFADLFEAVGIDVAVSPREGTAEEITRFTRGRRAENVAVIEGDRAEVLELEVGSGGEAVGRTIADLAADLPEGVVFGAITRNGTLVPPRGDTVVRDGDHVVVFADAEAVEAVTETL
ncbi:Trk system potassium transporter TrkA [Halorarius halobius]|uniref:Trk system potassium transporter TrkA n=1 Tax=Halorarius halobius TaxID=2962671 RepID=UPI0020CE736E|nr:Trk system potassium transporter TrkA [Halorarius halobius]